MWTANLNCSCLEVEDEPVPSPELLHGVAAGSPSRRERRASPPSALRKKGAANVPSTVRSRHRSYEELREHYVIERELANRLRSSSRAERATLYGELYDELFRRVPLHPQLTRKADPAQLAREVAQQVRLLKPLLRPEGTFLEIGAGDCAVSLAVAKQVRKVYALDVSTIITACSDLPRNVEVVISDGASVRVPPASVDVAYSNQLMEHLHEEDALDQVRNIYDALAPGGVYVCVTPNRLSGPHDVSRYFSDVATGFHLKEYTICELRRLFGSAGFSKVETIIGGRGWYLRTSALPIEIFEKLLATLPPSARRMSAKSFLCTAIIGARVLATKRRTQDREA